MLALAPLQYEPDLLSVTEFCRRLSIGRTVAYEIIAAGEVASLLIGRKRLIPRAELEKFIAARLKSAPAAGGA